LGGEEEEEERDGGNDENMYNKKNSFKVHFLIPMMIKGLMHLK
jgi:hypothetical protein